MKRILAVLLAMLSTTVFLFAQEEQTDEITTTATEIIEENRSPHEVGVYFKDYFPVARMHNHSYNFIGGGISYAYHIPDFPLGFSCRMDAVTTNANDNYVYDWCTFNVFAGTFYQWSVLPWLELQPSIEYGIQVDVVHSSRLANGPYVNQGIQFSPTFKFRPESINKDGLSIEVTPLYTLSFEPDGLAHYFGARIGFMYRIGGKNLTKLIETQVRVEYIEKEVIKEVIKEVPVPVTKAPEPEKPVVVKSVQVKIRDDGTVDIQVPTLLFVSDKTELTEAKSNQETLNKVYDILTDSTYSDFQCVVTGFVNSDREIWSKDEEKLAYGRATTIVSELVKRGIDSNRFKAEFGSGKTENKEYNRRVEFNLKKK